MLACLRATLAEQEAGLSCKQGLDAVGGGGGGGGGGGAHGPVAALTMPEPQQQAQHPAEAATRAALEAELASKEHEIAQLVEDAARLRSTLRQLQESSAKQIAKLEEQREAEQRMAQSLQQRLQEQQDYEQIKRELSIYRARELSLAAERAAREAAADRTEERDRAMALKIKQELPDESKGTTTPSADLADDAAPDEERASLASSRPGSARSASPAPPRSTPSASTPVHNTTTTTPASSPHAPHAPLPPHLLVNGSPKSPSEEGGLCSNNNTLSSNNNLLSAPGLLGPHNGLFMGPVPGVPLPGHHAAHSLSNLLRDSDALKSPFRFDEQRSPFRFSEDRSLTPNGVMMGRLGESLIPKGDPMEARLQEMLRYNMDKYANQNLDTLNIARRVRELLSIHNIGQRLFAKYVLGLSQGTVSELLSKPKPWDKLTEKGRDSYRKMHAWACDEHSVMLLKSLIPKKGKEASLPPFIASETQDMTEERIAHILSEASQLMRVHNPDELRSNEDSRSPADNRGENASPMNPKDGSPSRKVRKYENDDIPQEKVVRIYQEELAKIMGRRLEESMRGGAANLGNLPGARPGDQPPFPGLLFPHFMEGGAGGLPLAARSQDDIRLALDTYHRELAKLNMAPGMEGLPPPVGLPGLLALQQQALAQQAHAMQQQQQQQQQQHQEHREQLRNGEAQDLSLPKERPKESRNSRDRELNGSDRDERGDRGSEAGDRGAGSERGSSVASEAGSTAERLKKEMAEATAEALRPLVGSSAFSLVRPKDGDQAGADMSGTAAVSPLQRMASITNSLISQQASAPSHTTQSPRPLKAVLPPITQQQFDQFNNLNTEEIVRKVKESLSQYSISQRLFGENVLGLSQGSVSDLLARPKPWHMLTQKGREPFIRMKMFLEDDNAVHKLVASQYKIAPEKLMRTGGYGVNPPIPSSRSHPAASRLANLPEDMLSRLSDQHAHSKAALLQHMAAHPGAHHGVHPHGGHPGHPHHPGQAFRF